MKKAARRPRPSASKAPVARELAPAFFPIGTQGLKHPAWEIGLWALGRWSPEDETRTRATIDRALDLGVRTFDTAEIYGNGRSERLLGDALARHGVAEDQVFIGTKVSSEHLRPSQVRAAATGSLQRLARKSVDVYLIHFPDPRVPVAETLGAMEELRREGRFRAVGVSNFSVGDLERAKTDAPGVELAVNQVRLSLLNREEEPTLEYCRNNGIAVEAYTPLARGLLAGRYLDGGEVPPEVRRFAHDLFGADMFPKLKRRARALQALAREARVPMASVALHWLAGKGAFPVVGVSRPEQVDELLAAWSQKPPADVLEQAETIAAGTDD